MKHIARFAFALALAAGAAAAAPPSGPEIVALLARVTGIVRVTRAGTEAAAPGVAGISLYASDRITTLNGRAEVQFPNGNILRLKSDTVLTVVPPEEPQKKSLARTFAFLARGSVRALVRSVRPDEGFSIRSANAIASVKGTDLLFDGSSVQVRDEGDSAQHQVDLSDPDGLHHLLVGEGMEGGFDAGGAPIEPHAADPGAFDRFDLDNAGNNSTGGANGGGSTTGEGTQGGQGGGTTAGSGDTGGDESEALRADAEAFESSDDLGDMADRDEHQGDKASGSVLYDRHGYAYVMENRVFLENAHTIKYVDQATRSDGDNLGTTTLESRLMFNVDLDPDHFEDQRRGVAATFRDPSVFPPLYLTEEDWQVTNPANDTVKVQNLLDTPQPVDAAYYPRNPLSYDTASHTWSYSPSDPTQVGWAQGFEYRRWVGSADAPALKEHFKISFLGDVAEGWYAGVTPPDTYPATVDGFPCQSSGQTQWASQAQSPTWDGMYGYDTGMVGYDNGNLYDYYEGAPVFNNPYFGSGTRTTTSLGAFSVREDVTYGDRSTFSMVRRLITPEGEERDPFSLAEFPTEDAVHAATEPLNYEVEFGADEFHGRMIDIIAPTQFWDDAVPHGIDSNGHDHPLDPAYIG